MQTESSHFQISDQTEKHSKIIAILKRAAHMEGEIALDDSLAGFQQWDSLAVLDFMMDVELQLCVELSPDDLHKCRTVEDIVNLIESKGQK